MEKAQTTIHYYISSRGENPVKEFLDSLQENQQAKILRIFQYIEEYGLQVVLPHIKKLAGSPLWEIRILGKDNIRILYIIAEKNAILVLHGFIKKKQKTPHKEIDIAINRYKIWQGD
jgi:phage-related protein